MRCLALAVLLALTGCATAIPGAERVTFTRNPQDVAGCKIAGREFTFARESAVRERVFIEGADTVLITSVFGWQKVGVPYNCSGLDPRQPIPVK